MNNEVYKDATDVKEQAPLYVQAEDTLNNIRESLMGRAATIEGEQKRLSDEYGHIMSVLNRIVPPAPQAIGGYAVPSGPPGPSTNRGW